MFSKFCFDKFLEKTITLVERRTKSPFNFRVELVFFSYHFFSKSRKYSSNVLMSIHNIHVSHSMNGIEKGMYTANGLSTETHKNFLIHYGLRGKNVESEF